MRYRIFICRGRAASVLLPFFFIFLMMALPALVVASESCSMLGGKCRDACGGNERAEAGDFEDCGAKQECCVAYVEAPVKCCVMSFDARDFGRSNCRPPESGACTKGSGSPVPCAKLPTCGAAK